MRHEHISIALRAYIPSIAPVGRVSDTRSEDHVVVVIDTETTEDEYHNLLFGTCGIWISGYLHKFILFHARNLSQEQVSTLRQYARMDEVNGTRIELMPVDQFIIQLFFPWLIDAQALCVGFNLPFDLSRLAIRYGYGRGKWNHGFTFNLCKDEKYPRLKIRSLDSIRSFFALAPTRITGRIIGHFVDLRALGFALTNEKLSLKRACELFDTSHRKSRVEGHGKITAGYVGYNVNDTLATYDLYRKMVERLREFRLDISPEMAFSPASLGKAYLRKMGIQPFLEKNPEFPSEILGYVMTSFYGGRSEVKIRKKRVKVRLLDFKSMYPTMFTLMGLWRFLIAQKIEWHESTDETKKLVSKITLSSLTNPLQYPDLVTIVQVLPESDILPVRAHYGEGKQAYNIGINNLTSDVPLWYALPDVIASKLLTGRTAKILRAIAFKPRGTQHDLRRIEVPGGLSIGPETNFIKSVIEERKRIQEKRDDAKDRAQRETFDVIQNQLKILANATSYGIFVEINTEAQPVYVLAYGLKSFGTQASKSEQFGTFFNPIIAASLTSGARLMLAIAEVWLQQHAGYYAFCDTDSMAVSPRHWKPLQTFFQSLNPYDSSDPLLKLKHDDRNPEGQLLDLWFYGISAKRYALYRMVNGGPVLVTDGWSSHGLGHLLHERALDDESHTEWEKQLWMRIVKVALGKMSEEKLCEEYENEYAISRYAITRPSLHRRLKAINRGKDPCKQIKSYNFILIGQPAESDKNGQPIQPVTKFTSHVEEAPYQPFIDYNTGKRYPGGSQVYWKQLPEAIREYLNHPESKSSNGTLAGKMRRGRVHITCEAQIGYIGKETNKVEENEILTAIEDFYTKYKPEAIN